VFEGGTGVLAGHLGAVNDHPGAFAGRPGALNDRPGTLAGRPGAFNDRLGALAGRPGAFNDHLGALAGRPGAPNDRLGALTGRPGGSVWQVFVRAVRPRTPEIAVFTPDRGPPGWPGRTDRTRTRPRRSGNRIAGPT